MKAIKNNKGTTKNCGSLTSQSTSYLQGIPASAGMTALSSRHCGLDPQSPEDKGACPLAKTSPLVKTSPLAKTKGNAETFTHDRLIFRSFFKKIFSVVGVFFLICFVMCLSSNEMYAQKSKEKQREDVLVQLESQTKTFLATIETKLEENQIKKKALEMELAKLRAEKTKKKERAAKEQKIQYLRKKIALLEDKEKEYLRMKNEIVENFESILDIYRRETINN